MHGTSASRAYDVHHVVEWASNDCASKAQRERRGMKRAVSGSPASRSKARCTGFDRVSGWLDRDAGGNQAIGVDNRKPFGIFTALQIERLDRLVVGAIDMNYLARI